MAATAIYAKEAKLMEWEKDETSLSYDVLFNRKRALLIREAPFEYKFFVSNIGDSEDEFVEAAVTYHKVETISEELAKSDSIEPTRTEARNKVLAIANYRSDWDGYGAIRPLTECLSHALDFLSDEQLNVEYLTDIYPNPNGTISLEWEQGDNEIGLELGNREFSYYVQIGNHHSYNNKKQYVADEIARLVEYVSFLG